MRALLAVLLLGAALQSACSTKDTSPPSRDDVPYSGDVNWTDAEQEALRTVARPGWLVLRARAAGSGEPVTDCAYYSLRFAFEKRRVAPKLCMKISPGGPPRVRPDGRYRWKLAAGWHQLRLSADGFRPTWTPVFQIREGEETALKMDIRPTNRLRVRVFDENGEPLEDGAVLLDGKRYRSTMHIENGVGEGEVDVDEVTVSVGRVFLEEYAPQSVTVSLTPGEWNEVTIRLRK